MVNIAIIGAGQLGSRHLQALSKIDRPASIFVVYPFFTSLQIAQKRFEEVATEDSNVKDVKYLTTIETIPEKIEVAIIATNSDVRKEVIVNLVNSKKVDFLIIEKFMFPSIKSYNEVETLINKKDIKAYVNCGRRMWPFYKHLKEKFSTSNYINYQVSSSNLGLGCNAIHFLDHLSFLSEEEDFGFQSILDETISKSKRKGFVEFTGSLLGRANKCQIAITSYPVESAPISIIISSEKVRCVINESEGKAFISDHKNDWLWTEVSFDTLLQSQLTHLAVQQLIDKNICDLTPYHQSSKLHITLLKSFINHLRHQQDKEVTRCLIT